MSATQQTLPLIDALSVHDFVTMARGVAIYRAIVRNHPTVAHSQTLEIVHIDSGQAVIFPWNPLSETSVTEELARFSKEADLPMVTP